MKKRLLLAWSSGKDSAMALYELKQQPVQAIRGEKRLRDNRFYYCDLISPD